MENIHHHHEFWKFVDDSKVGDEYRAQTLRRLLLSGEITKENFLYVRNFGKRSWNEHLVLLGLKENETSVSE